MTDLQRAEKAETENADLRIHLALERQRNKKMKQMLEKIGQYANTLIKLGGGDDAKTGSV